MKEETKMKRNYCVVGNFKMSNGKIKTCLIVPLYGANEDRAKEVTKKYIDNPPQDCVGNIEYTWVDDANAWWLL